MIAIQEVSNVQLAFPADIGGLMVPYPKIPDEFKQDRNKWVKLQQRWFYEGLKGVSFIPKPGVDAGKALRHLKAIQGSFEPKHEHKEACVAYLMSEWFEDVVESPLAEKPQP